MENFDINKIDDYDKDELELFLSKERAYQSSGEVLLEATLKMPFKNKEKVDKILNKIDSHKSNIISINERISKLEVDKQNHTWISGYSNGIGTIIWGTANNYNSYGVSSPTIVVDLIHVKYIDNNNDIITIKVLDDVFESILGNYYLVMEEGVHVPLKRVIEIDEESNVGKWYSVMCKNFDRESKLKRVLKDGE